MKLGLPQTLDFLLVVLLLVVLRVLFGAAGS